jgi:hypothetical protein
MNKRNLSMNLCGEKKMGEALIAFSILAIIVLGFVFVVISEK